MIRIFTISFLFFLLVINSRGFGQTTVLLSAEQDNTIYADFPINSNGSGNTFLAGNADNNTRHRRSLIKFNIASAVPAGATITAVTLTLNVTRNNNGTNDVKLYKLLSDWGQGISDGGNFQGQGTTAAANDATWNCAKAVAGGTTCITPWTTAGGDFSATLSGTATVSSGATTWTDAQMVTDVQSWLNTSANNFGWLIRGEESVSFTTIYFASRENSTTPIQPQLSVSYTAAALPVTLTGLKVFSKNTGVQVEWITQQEMNIEKYEVERSTDAQQFTKIGSVQANNRSIVSTYNLLDAHPYSGINLYRIKIIDLSGKITYSENVKAIVASNISQVTILPNPVHGNVITLQLSNLQKGNYTVRLYNKLGQQILNKVIEYNGGSVRENIVSSTVMAPGTYQLKVTGKEITLTRQVIKN